MPWLRFVWHLNFVVWSTWTFCNLLGFKKVASSISFGCPLQPDTAASTHIHTHSSHKQVGQRQRHRSRPRQPTTCLMCNFCRCSLKIITSALGQENGNGKKAAKLTGEETGTGTEFPSFHFSYFIFILILFFAIKFRCLAPFIFYLHSVNKANARR